MDSIRAHRLRTNASTRLPSAVARRLSSPIPTVAPGSLRAVTRSGTSTPSRSVVEEVATSSPTASVPTPEFYKSAKTLKKEARLAAGVSAASTMDVDAEARGLMETINHQLSEIRTSIVKLGLVEDVPEGVQEAQQPLFDAILSSVTKIQSSSSLLYGVSKAANAHCSYLKET